MLIAGWWPSQIQLRAQPPIHDPDLALGPLDRDGEGPEVAAAVDKPLGAVLGARRGEAMEAIVRCVVQCMTEAVQVSMGMLLILEFGRDLGGQVLGVVSQGVKGIFGPVDEGCHLQMGIGSCLLELRWNEATGLIVAAGACSASEFLLGSTQRIWSGVAG